MSELIEKRTDILPMIALRGLVVFPHTFIHFDILRDKSVVALEQAMLGDQTVFLLAQKDASVSEPTIGDFEVVGTIARIKQVVKLPGNLVRILVEGIARAKLSQLLSEEKHFEARIIEVCAPEPTDKMQEEALKRRICTDFEKYASRNHKINPETVFSLHEIRDLSKLCDTVISTLPVSLDVKKELLAEFDSVNRANRIILVLAQETEILDIDIQISQKVKKQIDQNQREYFLREQMKVIEDELGDKDGVGLEVAEYEEKLKESHTPKSVKELCQKELLRLKKMQFGNPEANVIRTYLDWICALPWEKKTNERIDVKHAEKILERDHYGLKKIKERILEFLAVKKLSGNLGGPILCLVGPPGVGKTSIARSVAEALGRKYVRISLGGVRDEAEIRGHRRTYIGAMPGRIIKALKEAETKNPLMLFDEIDKMSSDFKGDPSSAMLEVLDSEQNSKFHDHFLDVDFDLSDVMFIATANSLDTIPKPLLDRMEIVTLSGYTAEEKLQICKKHLLPKQKQKHGFNLKALDVSDSALKNVINYYTREAGVRELERKMGEICRKAALKKINDESETISVTAKNLDEFLGKRIFSFDKISKNDEIGVVTGLAWTSVGGDTLSVEANVMSGSGKTVLTGKLGEVMQESAKAAISYIRANCEALGIDGDFYKTKDIHIHVPEGATPKDGPSAGITIATALASALSKTPVRRDVAMTGEITLRGRVLAIGGLKEKALAAYRAGVKTIIIPYDNIKDTEEFDAAVKNKLKIVPVKNVEEVFKTAFSENIYARETKSAVNAFE